jgi:hypothetical protein
LIYFIPALLSVGFLVLILCGVLLLSGSAIRLVKRPFERLQHVQIGSRKIKFDTKEGEFTEEKLKEISAALEEARNTPQERQLKRLKRMMAVTGGKGY